MRKLLNGQKALDSRQLSDHLLAGIKRYQHTGEPRNPDEAISSFRVQYAGLLRDEYPHLYKLLSARGKELFDGSQKWFYFKLTNGVEIVHKISNNVYEQNVNDEQYLSLHILGKGSHLNELPDPRFKRQLAHCSNPIRRISLPSMIYR